MKTKRFLYIIAFTTGALALGFEIIISQMLLPYFENSTAIWAGVISVTLLYIAIGSMLGGMLIDKYGNIFRIYAYIPLICSLATIIIVNPYSFILKNSFEMFSASPFFKITIAAVSIFIFSLPILIISSILPIITCIMIEHIREQRGTTIGRVYAVNTIGSIFGALVSALLLLPYLGAEGCIYIFAFTLMLISFFMFYMIKTNPIQSLSSKIL